MTSRKPPSAFDKVGRNMRQALQNDPNFAAENNTQSTEGTWTLGAQLYQLGCGAETLGIQTEL